MEFDANCKDCKRLSSFLTEVKKKNPYYFCRPVPSFGSKQPFFLIVGLAPGMHGANKTGRPFTGDHAKKEYKFSHGKRHNLPNNLVMYDSYHCSRYNTQTKRLTEQMFEEVFLLIKNEMER